MNFTNRQTAQPTPLFYTAKNINATAASRTAINADLKPGYVVVQDVYCHDSKVSGVTNSAGSTADSAENRLAINVTRPESSHLAGRAFVVTSVPPIVNTIPDSSASTQRKGGHIEGCSSAAQILALVADGVAVGDELILANGSFALTASTTISNIAAIRGFKAKALEANSSGASALRYVEFHGGT